MTVQAPPDATNPSERHPPSKRTRATKRVAVLYNVDYEDRCPANDPAWAARAEVGVVAQSVASALGAAGVEAHRVPIDGDLTSLRARMNELEPDCAFNLCESLAGDARLESAVPLVLELLGVPFTGSPPEVLSFALRKDRVKRRLEAAGIPTPSGRVMKSPDDPCDLAVSAHRQTRARRRVRRYLANERGARPGRARAGRRHRRLHLSPALLGRAVHRRARVQRLAAGAPDAAGAAALRDRLLRACPPTRRASSRMTPSGQRARSMTWARFR